MTPQLITLLSAHPRQRHFAQRSAEHVGDQLRVSRLQLSPLLPVCDELGQQGPYGGHVSRQVSEKLLFVLTHVHKGLRVALSHAKLLLDDGAECVGERCAAGHNSLHPRAVPDIRAQENFSGQRFLTGKMAVDGSFLYPSRSGNVPHTRAVASALGKKGERGLDYGGSLGVRFLLQYVHILVDVHQQTEREWSRGGLSWATMSIIWSDIVAALLPHLRILRLDDEGLHLR